MPPSTASLLTSFAAWAILCGSVTTSMGQAYSQPENFGPLVSTGYSSDIEARLAALEAAAAADEEPEWIEVGNENWDNEYGGRIMADYFLFADQNAASQTAYGNPQNYFEMRRMRFYMSGTGYGVYDYILQVEFGPELGLVAMKDAYVAIKELPWLGHVHFGNFKEPFGLEAQTKSNYITFMERTAATEVFAPSRHVGVCLFNHNLEQTATWAIGAFFGNIDRTDKQRMADNQGIDVAMRYTCLPIYGCEGRSLLHLGTGYVYSDVQGDTLRLRARPETNEEAFFLDAGDTAAVTDVSDFHRINVEIASLYGPFSVQSELFFGHTNNLAISDQDYYGAYVQGSYFLTGEHRPYKKKSGKFGRVKPNTNFWIVRTANGVQSGWGALEAVVRFSYLDLDGPELTDAKSGQYRAFTTGLNWYWNSHTRMMFNWNHATTDVVAAAGTETEILSMRMQVDF